MTADHTISDRRIQDFRALKFGMFIHFNMGTYQGAQWVKGYPRPADFDPGGTIDTDAWADAAVSAGMTYGVLTVKHVAGFCLWDSQTTAYSVMHPDCPYQRDLVAQFVESFTRRGLKVGLYYLWRNPGFDDGEHPGEYKVLPPECDPATHSLAQQIAFQQRQLAELVAMFPDVFYLWNDALDPRVMPAADALAFIRGCKPDMLVSANWWDWGKKGEPYADIAVTEQRHFPEDNRVPGETCWCLEQKWFWEENFAPQAASGIVAQIDSAHARGANFLLNVGPDRRGNITPESVGVLAEIGAGRLG